MTMSAHTKVYKLIHRHHILAFANWTPLCKARRLFTPARHHHNIGYLMPELPASPYTISTLHLRAINNGVSTHFSPSFMVLQECLGSLRTLVSVGAMSVYLNIEPNYTQLTVRKVTLAQASSKRWANSGRVIIAHAHMGYLLCVV